MITARIIEEFDRHLPGRVLRPSHADFDQVRRVYNGMIDRKPALIAQCHGTRDVVAAVRLARTHDIPIRSAEAAITSPGRLSSKTGS